MNDVSAGQTQAPDLADRFLESHPFGKIRCGDFTSLVRVVTAQDIQLFAAVTGNVNPTHVDAAYMKDSPTHGVVADAMLGASLVSTVLGTQLPGPGTVYLGQTLSFVAPVVAGDALTVTATVMSIDRARQAVLLYTRCTNQRDEVVLQGQATVAAPTHTQRVRRADPVEALHVIHGRPHYGALLDAAARFSRIRLGLLDTASLPALEATMAAARLGLIEAVLIGPEARIRELALERRLDLAAVRIVDTDIASVVRIGLEMAASGTIDALTIGEVDKAQLLSHLARRRKLSPSPVRLSHVAVLDVPRLSRFLFVTDSEVAVRPDLQAKETIVSNAIDVAQSLGVARPRIALLAASDDPEADLQSTIDANALVARARSGALPGCEVEGPMTLASAMAAREDANGDCGAASRCGADIFVVPEVEAGRMVIDGLVSLGAAQGVGLVIGAEVPILLTRQTDSLQARVAGCAVALLFLKHERYRSSRDESHEIAGEAAQE